jgi:hypothetical protein
MDALLPHFPLSNPILHGIASLLQGEDLEKTLARRDELLTSSAAFVQATWEALAWLPVPSPLAQPMIEQASLAWDTLPVEAQTPYITDAAPSAHQILALDYWTHRA